MQGGGIVLNQQHRGGIRDITLIVAYFAAGNPRSAAVLRLPAGAVPASLHGGYAVPAAERVRPGGEGSQAERGGAEPE